MKGISKLILAAVILFAFTFISPNTSSAASGEVKQGFYINNSLDISLEDFTKISKKQKKKYILNSLKSSSKVMFVLDKKIYNFKEIIFLDDLNGVGESVEDYVAKNGPLVEKPTVEFEVIDIY